MNKWCLAVLSLLAGCVTKDQLRQPVTLDDLYQVTVVILTFLVLAVILLGVTVTGDLADISSKIDQSLIDAREHAEYERLRKKFAPGDGEAA